MSYNSETIDIIDSGRNHAYWRLLQGSPSSTFTNKYLCISCRIFTILIKHFHKVGESEKTFISFTAHVYWRSLLGSYLFMHNFPNHIYLETQIFRQYISKLSDLINDCNGNAELYKHFINCDGRICSI